MKRFLLLATTALLIQTPVFAFDISGIVNTIKNVKEQYQARSSTQNTAQAGNCNSFAPSGIPVNAKKYGITMRCYSEFGVAYDPKLGTSRYAIEVLTRDKVSTKVERETQFIPDSEVQSPSTKDYSTTGFDRGHLAAAANMSNSKAMSESFYTTNIAPQDPGNNRAVWMTLEGRVRDIAESGKTLEVITGPIFTKEEWMTKKNGQQTRVAVPQFFFKIVKNVQTNQYTAVKIPNKAYDKNTYDEFYVSLEQLNRDTGFTFYPNSKKMKQVSFNNL